jgi:hypothetical protein
VEAGILVRLERATTTIEEHARRLSDLESARPAVLAAEVRELREDVRECREEIKQAKRAMWAVAIAFLTGTLTLALTLLQILGTSPT